MIKLNVKKLFYFFSLLFSSVLVYAQNVGIGITTPLARLHITDSNVIFTAPTVTSDPAAFTTPVNGAGARLMWLPKKGAFRVGSVNGDYWNGDNIGLYSFGAGHNVSATGVGSTAMGDLTTASGDGSASIGGSNTASGSYSIALGTANLASGDFSTAIGYNTKATASISTAMGNTTLASEYSSTAMGQGSIASGASSTATGFLTKASGNGATAMGSNTTASGIASTSLGYYTTATGISSVAMGSSTLASGDQAFASGSNTTARSFASIATGQYNDSIISSNKTTWVATDPLLIIGNGTASFSRHNAFVVYKNGNTDHNGFTRLGEITDGAPRIKTKKITGYNTPSTANPNTWTFVPHGISDPDKILSISVIVTNGSYQFLPHSPDAPYVFTVNTDPTGGGVGQNIAVGVKSTALSSGVMGKPIKILITYEE